jgi:hypothetical protein
MVAENGTAGNDAGADNIRELAIEMSQDHDGLSAASSRLEQGGGKDNQPTTLANL